MCEIENTVCCADDGEPPAKRKAASIQVGGTFKWNLQALTTAADAVQLGGKSPVSALNELGVRVSYALLRQGGPAHCPIFTVALKVADMTFEGWGHSKRDARAAAARSCLSALLARAGRVMPPETETQVMDFTSDFSDKFTVSEFQCLEANLNTTPVPVTDEVMSVPDSPTSISPSTGLFGVLPPVPSFPKSPINLLYENYPGLSFLCSFGDGSPLNGPQAPLQLSHSMRFKVVCQIKEQIFEGYGSSKKLAKLAAARAALAVLCDGRVESSSAVSDGALPQTLADHVSKLVNEKFNELMKDDLTHSKRKVLAGIVLTIDKKTEGAKVIAVTTGTKCVSGEHMSVRGRSVNDCHAEVAARRCFQRYLYAQLLIYAAQSNPQAMVPELDIEPVPGGGYQMKGNRHLHLYVSTAPCGDGRIFSPHEPNEPAPDRHPNRQARGQLRTKIESGEGTIPVKNSTNVLQTWDGVMQGERLLTMSCSDKVARWCVVGLQGALLSRLVRPVYLHSLVLGSLLHPHHMYRALCGRIEGSISSLPPPFQLHKPILARAASTEARTPARAPSFSVCWSITAPIPEVLNAMTGKLESGQPSLLCKQSMFARWQYLMRRLTPIKDDTFMQQKNARIDENILYNEAKQMCTAYQEAKSRLFEAFERAKLGKWIKKPQEQDQFVCELIDADPRFLFAWAGDGLCGYKSMQRVLDSMVRGVGGETGENEVKTHTDEGETVIGDEKVDTCQFGRGNGQNRGEISQNDVDIGQNMEMSLVEVEMGVMGHDKVETGKCGNEISVNEEEMDEAGRNGVKTGRNLGDIGENRDEISINVEGIGGMKQNRLRMFMGLKDGNDAIIQSGVGFESGGDLGLKLADKSGISDFKVGISDEKEYHYVKIDNKVDEEMFSRKFTVGDSERKDFLGIDNINIDNMKVYEKNGSVNVNEEYDISMKRQDLIKGVESDVRSNSSCLEILKDVIQISVGECDNDKVSVELSSSINDKDIDIKLNETEKRVNKNIHRSYNIEMENLQYAYFQAAERFWNDRSSKIQSEHQISQYIDSDEIKKLVNSFNGFNIQNDKKIKESLNANVDLTPKIDTKTPDAYKESIVNENDSKITIKVDKESLVKENDSKLTLETNIESIVKDNEFKRTFKIDRESIVKENNSKWTLQPDVESIIKEKDSTKIFKTDNETLVRERDSKIILETDRECIKENESKRSALLNKLIIRKSDAIMTAETANTASNYAASVNIIALQKNNFKIDKNEYKLDESKNSRTLSDTKLYADVATKVNKTKSNNPKTDIDMNPRYEINIHKKPKPKQNNYKQKRPNETRANNFNRPHSSRAQNEYKSRHFENSNNDEKFTNPKHYHTYHSDAKHFDTNAFEQRTGSYHVKSYERSKREKDYKNISYHKGDKNFDIDTLKYRNDSKKYEFPKEINDTVNNFDTRIKITDYKDKENVAANLKRNVNERVDEERNVKAVVSETACRENHFKRKL